MNLSVYNISLDLHDQSSQIHLKMKKSDTARMIAARLTENGKPFTLPDGCTAVFCAVKPDSTYLYNSCLVTQGVVKYAVTEQTTAAVGIYSCELRIYGALGEMISSPRFDISVSDTECDDLGIVSSSEGTELARLAAEAIRVTDLVRGKLERGELDGFDPIVTLTRIDEGVRVDITNRDGTESKVIYDGRDFKFSDLTPEQFEILAACVVEASQSTVLFVPQELTEGQKAQARENIGADAESVLFVPQELSKSEKAQVRENIGAVSNNAVGEKAVAICIDNPGTVVTGKHAVAIGGGPKDDGSGYPFNAATGYKDIAIGSGAMVCLWDSVNGVPDVTSEGQPDEAIQIGTGVCQTPNIAQFGGSTMPINDLAIYQDEATAQMWGGKNEHAGYKILATRYLVNKLIEAATENKLEAVTSTSDAYRLYGVSNTGSQVLMKLTGDARSGSIPARDSYGRFSAGEPVDDSHVATKKYVDDSKYLGIKVNAKTDSDTVTEIKPNIFYIFPEMASLDISFAAPERDDVVNEYKFRFTSGATATTLSLPSTVIGDFAIAENCVYEVSVIDGYIAFRYWEVA